MGEPVWGKWGRWEEAEAHIGQVIGVTVAPDLVEAGAIRRWLEPKEFDCTLHTDATVAKAAGHDGIVAPSTMILTYGVDAYWRPEDGFSEEGYEPKQISIPVIFDVPAPCTLSFATSIDMEFFAPVHVGDQITCTSRLKSITRKELRVGKGAFFRQEDSYANQDGTIVAVVKLDIFRFNPPEKGDS